MTTTGPAPAPPLTYGPPISLAMARLAMAAAEAEAVKNHWPVAIAIVDSGGHLVMMHRLDNTQIASARICEGKARTALEFKRPSKALEDMLGSGPSGLRVLSFGATAAEGGVLVVVDGKIIGAIGVSGVISHQDAQVAMAGAAAVAK
jgi:glc operon protein GlcG